MKYSLRSLMRFSLRDLFWLTVIFALFVSLWIEQRKHDNQKRIWEEHLYKLGVDRSMDKAEITRLELGLPKPTGPVPVFAAPAPNPPKK